MSKLGYCGDNCKVCPRYIATLSGNMERVKEVAVLWCKAGYRDGIVPWEELLCRGCSTAICNKEDRRVLRECALEKGVENCGKCENYPCEKVSNVFEETELAAKNIKEKCSREEYEWLRKALLSKKENLDRVNREWRSQAKGASPG